MAIQPDNAELGVDLRDARLFFEMAIVAACRPNVDSRADRTWTQNDPAWEAFRGELGPRDIVELRIRNEVPLRPWLFDMRRFVPEAPRFVLRASSEERFGIWLRAARSHAEETPRQYLKWAAERLLTSVPDWRLPLPSLLPSQVALELPGTGGLLAYRVTSQSPGVYFSENFRVLGGSWRERLLAGLVAMELAAPSGLEIPFTMDPGLSSLENPDRRYDLVLGRRDTHSHLQGSLEALLSDGGQVALL